MEPIGTYFHNLFTDRLEDLMENGPVPSLITDPKRSALMSRIRQRGTKPELLVAKALTALGIRYRKNAKGLPGSPDFVNRRRRWAIFVNGCYWHHHRCRRGTVPKRNREFWTRKFSTNRRRDAQAIRRLRMAGYKVVLVWECQVLAGEPLHAKLLGLVPQRDPPELDTWGKESRRVTVRGATG